LTQRSPTKGTVDLARALSKFWLLARVEAIAAILDGRSASPPNARSRGRTSGGRFLPSRSAPRLPVRLVRHLLVVAARRADLGAPASGRLEAEALAFQVEALAREAEELRRLVYVRTASSLLKASGGEVGKPSVLSFLKPVPSPFTTTMAFMLA